MRFKNGSKLKTIGTTNNVRGNRSKLIGFYCSACNKIHIDFPIINMIFIDTETIICKQGYEQIIKI